MSLKNQHFKNFLPALIILLPLILMSGCGSSGMTLSMAGLPNVNPDSTGRPSPVLIKMYELKSEPVFKQAEMLPLFEDPTGVLGPDMVAFDEITLVPGEAKTIVYEPSPETRFVGILACFRDSGKGPWKVIKTVNPEKSSKIALELNGSSLILIADDKTKRWDPVEAVNNYKEKSDNVAASSSYSGKKVPAEALANGQVEPALSDIPKEAEQPTPRPMRKK